MSNLFITSAIRDIIPTTPEPYPSEIISYANSLYVSSKLTFPLSGDEEAGRYHLCCFVTIEYFQNMYNLPDPFQNKIPIPRRKAAALLQRFRTLFSTMIASTPMAKRIVDIAALPTPSTGSSTQTDASSKLNFSPSTQSYIDKVRASKYNTLDSVKKSLRNALMDEENSTTNDVLQTPPSTPRKTPRKAKRIENATPVKLSPYKSRTRVVITTPILVSFCNKFYIPEHITQHILQTFKLYQHVVTNSWGLLVGLVGISYLQLNKKEVKQRIGLRSRLIETLHRIQQGGLSDIEVKRYIREVARMISKSKWIKEAHYADEEAIIDAGDGAAEQDFALSSLGSFLDSSVEYVTMKDTDQVERWVRSIRRVSANSRSKINPKIEEDGTPEPLQTL